MRFDYFQTNVIGTLTLAADEQGLRHIVFETAKQPLAIPGDWQRDAPLFAQTKAQLRAFFNGEIQQFDLPLAPEGTPFQRRVWQCLQTIPYGATVSYGWVAERIGNPKSVRAVGGANARNPLPIVIPCHRVIGGNGALTGFGGGLGIKQRLIDLEAKNLAA